MMAVYLMFYVTVVLQCFAWCDLSCKPTKLTVTLESFARQNRARRFLLMTEKWGEFTMSFTGRRGQPGTKFIWTKGCTASNLEFTLHPAGIPDHILVVDKGKLLVKNSSMVDMDDNNCKLEKRTVTLKYSDSVNNLNVTERYQILVFKSRPPAVIKGSKSGKVFLDKWKNWKDSQAWVKIKEV
ncbi:uncharacterized protein LOC144660526 isoform X2 [Oculina patagonica]